MQAAARPVAEAPDLLRLRALRRHDEMIAERGFDPDRERLDEKPRRDVVFNDGGPAHRDAQTANGRLVGRIKKIAVQLPLERQAWLAGTVQPQRPLILVEQRRGRADDGRLLQRFHVRTEFGPAQVVRTADGKQFLFAQTGHDHGRPPVREAVLDRQVVVEEVGFLERHRRADTDLDLRVFAREVPDRGDQAFDREGADAADRQDAGAVLVDEPVGGVEDVAQDRARIGQELQTFGGQRHHIAVAVEQRLAQHGFQRLDPLADRALRNVQFRRRTSKTQMARDGLEREQPGRRRQLFHRWSLVAIAET